MPFVRALAAMNGFGRSIPKTLPLLPASSRELVERPSPPRSAALIVGWQITERRPASTRTDTLPLFWQRVPHGRLVLLHQIVELLEMRDNALQCTITSVAVRFAAMEARYRPRRGIGVTDDWDDNDSQYALAICERSKLGDNQPLDLFLRSRLFFTEWITTGFRSA
jgi:hypothetical protein